MLTAQQLLDVRENWEAQDDEFVLGLEDSQVNSVTQALDYAKVGFTCGVFESEPFIIVDGADEGELLKAVREAGEEA